MTSDFLKGTFGGAGSEARPLIRSNTDRGFSILELMIAILVLLFGFIAMINLIATSIVVNRSSNRLTSLTMLASDKLEQLRTLDINDPQLQVPAGSTTAGSLDDDSTQDVGGTQVSYFDTIFVDPRDGSITRTSRLDDQDQYNSVKQTMAGTTTTTPSGGEPTQVSYRRRWLIQKDPAVLAGATRITVEVAVKTNKLSDADLPQAATGYRQVIRITAVR
jgi:Tfp pilus assembly protein PilV